MVERECCSRSCASYFLILGVILFHFFHIVHMKHEYDDFFLYLLCHPFIHLLAPNSLPCILSTALVQRFHSIFFIESNLCVVRWWMAAYFFFLLKNEYFNKRATIMMPKELKNENKCSGFFKVIMMTEWI